MADCSQFLVNYWAGEKVLEVRYIDLVQPSKRTEPHDVDADEIKKRIKNGLNKIARKDNKDVESCEFAE